MYARWKSAGALTFGWYLSCPSRQRVEARDLSSLGDHHNATALANYPPEQLLVPTKFSLIA